MPTTLRLPAGHLVGAPAGTARAGRGTSGARAGILVLPWWTRRGATA
ncbi:MAG: hypothetical protein ACLQOZ_00135 [Acidimicrobiales bacterium]